MRYVRIVKQHSIETCLVQLAAFNLQIYVELIHIITQQIIQRRIRNLLSSQSLWSSYAQASQEQILQLRFYITTIFVEEETQLLNVTCIVV